MGPKMGSFIRSIALSISNPLFQRRLPSSSAAAASYLSYMRRVGSNVESAAPATETMGGGAESREERAYDAATGKAEKVKETVIAEANENVMDTSEYRSMEEMGSLKTCSF